MKNSDFDTRPSAAPQEIFETRFRAFVGARSFPCVAAKSAMNRGRMTCGLYGRLDDQAAAQALHADLERFSASHPRPGLEPVSYVAMFRHGVVGEDAFHDQLWRHLQRLHDIDMRSHAWDASVSDDVSDSGFSFSVAGRAFFVVGLHPDSSRLARRAPFPCLVFNFHDQFEALRTSGKYDVLKAAIRDRDIALQGGINPVLAAFGESSEARQYSGRADPAGSRCPFHSRHAHPVNQASSA